MYKCKLSAVKKMLFYAARSVSKQYLNVLYQYREIMGFYPIIIYVIMTHNVCG